jgi:FAD/FMN-containing dehydrogenase
VTVLDNSTLRLTAPGEERYDAARQAFNLTLDQRPALIAEPTDADQVAAVVRFAAAQGYRVAPQATGHNGAPLGSLEESVLLKTSAMKGVEIDASARRARVLAGSKWEEVMPRASELGLAALHGSSPDVGVVGYSLGGGMGWYARKHGLQTNSVTAIELVTADGEQLRTDPDNEPELFWALRGGGGNFGVVTAIEFDLFPLEQVYAGTLFFPYERASEVMHAWREWTADTPDEITSTAKLLQFPPLPDIPEVVRGQSFAVVSAAYLGEQAEGAEIMRPLRELGPAMDTFAMVRRSRCRSWRWTRRTRSPTPAPPRSWATCPPGASTTCWPSAAPARAPSSWRSSCARPAARCRAPPSTTARSARWPARSCRSRWAW